MSSDRGPKTYSTTVIIASEGIGKIQPEKCNNRLSSLNDISLTKAARKWIAHCNGFSILIAFLHCN